MANDKLALSLQEGAHAMLGAMTGDWRGTTRTWFEPGKLGNESAITGSIRAVLGGRFLLHEYECTFQDKPEQGMALYGYHIDEGMFEAAWIDDFHTGTEIQFAQGSSKSGGKHFDVTGTYFAGEGEPRWGWRTEISQPEKNHLLIVMYNIFPSCEEAKAVEFDYRRI